MNKSLTRQMFFTLLGSFLGIIAVTLAVLLVYFQYFYQNEKIDRVIDNMNTFISAYEEENWNDNKLFQEISNFNNTNGLDLWVYEEYVYDYENSRSIYSNVENAMTPNDESYYYITVTDGIEYYDFMLESDEYYQIRSYDNLKNSDGMYIEGKVDDFGFLIVERINNTLVDSSVDLEEEVDTNDLESVKSQVVILSAQEIFTVDYDDLFLASDLVDYDDLLVTEEITEDDTVLVTEETTEDNTVESIDSIELTASNMILPELIEAEKDGIQYTISEIPYTNYKQVTFSKNIVINDKPMEVYTTLSLQPVSEVIEVLYKYIPYYFVIALMLAIVIAAIYSKHVSQPIVNITKAAEEMADLNLDKRLEITRQDELGQLSVALNVLALRLKGSMDQLVEKNKQLARDFKQKEMQEEARKAFIANASHELKTPLGIIKSYAEAIDDGVKVEKQEYYMSVIMDEIDSMDHLILDMLSLSKLDVGKEPIKTSFNIMELVRESSEKLQIEYEETGIELNIKEADYTVTADKEQMNRVIKNLISNAFKYGNKNSTINIEAINSSDDMTLYFKNDCDRFSEEQLVKVWDRFYKIDEAHNRRDKGHGLGLSIVQSILEAHNSNYGVYNTRQGVCFYFSLPLVREYN